MLDVREALELDFQALLLREDNFLRVLAVEVEEVRRVRGGNDLHRRPRLTEILRVAQPVQRILQVPQQPWMQAAVDFLQANNYRWLGQVTQRQEGKCQQRALREFPCWN